MTKLLKLGSFTVTDEIIVADPCYHYDNLRTLILDNVLSGKYIATAEVEKISLPLFTFLTPTSKMIFWKVKEWATLRWTVGKLAFSTLTFSARMKAVKSEI